MLEVARRRAWCLSLRTSSTSLPRRWSSVLHRLRLLSRMVGIRVRELGALLMCYPGGGFKTDSDISGNIATRERELRRWQPEEAPENGLSLDDQRSGPNQGWDQFEANKRLFGIDSKFDENAYTTTLDRSHPQYQQREAKAAKIAADIEGQASTSAHVAEERGLNVPDDSGMDEEDKYAILWTWVTQGADLWV